MTTCAKVCLFLLLLKHVQAMFDISKESYFKIFTPYELEILRHGISPDGDASTIISYLATLVSVAQFDALAPYHPTSEGILAKMKKRPYHERSMENKNLAAIYSGARLLRLLIPTQASLIQKMFWELRLDPDDTQENDKSPIGIGNMVARLVYESCVNDGMNLNGAWDQGGNLRTANLLPFFDYTGYQPVNSVNQFEDPEKWQPGLAAFHPGIYSAQQFLTPQMRLVTPFSFEDPSSFSVDPHARIKSQLINTAKPQKGVFESYSRSVKELLFFASDLSEAQKTVAEFFDDKIKSVLASTLHMGLAKRLSPDEYSQLDLTTKLAVFDMLIVVWQLKTTWDSCRPFSAIPFAMQDQLVPSYLAVNGTFGSVSSDEWKSFLPMPNYPEYPSATAAICYAHSEAMRRSLNADGLKWMVDINQGSSKVEPGVTPRRNMTLSFYTWTEFEKNCAYSRLYGGVNFPDSVANVKDLSLQMGRRSVDFVRYHVNLAQESSSSEEQSDEISSRDRSQSAMMRRGKKDKQGSNYKYLIMYDP